MIIEKSVYKHAVILSFSNRSNQWRCSANLFCRNKISEGVLLVVSMAFTRISLVKFRLGSLETRKMGLFFHKFCCRTHILYLLNRLYFVNYMKNSSYWKPLFQKKIHYHYYFQWNFIEKDYFLKNLFW